MQRLLGVELPGLPIQLFYHSGLLPLFQSLSVPLLDFGPSHRAISNGRPVAYNRSTNGE